MRVMNIKKRYWISTLMAAGFTFGVVCLEKWPRNGTPYQEGSAEWVGYTAAQGNNFKKVEECSSDTETKNDAGYVAGCKAWLDNR